MNEDNLKQLVAQGLAAMRAGGQVAAAATDEITNDASAPALKTALQQGNETAKQWAAKIERAIEQTGGGATQDNPILTAHYEVSRRIRAQAPDDLSRDLGIIAAGQLALHYWIATFGTMANYANHLGMTEVARDMKSMDEEAKQADAQHTQLAEQLLA